MLPHRRNIHGYLSGYRKIKRNQDLDADSDTNSERFDLPDADQSNEKEINERG